MSRDYFFESNIEEVLEELSKKKKTILKGWGKMVETDSKKLCPVDTGRLRNSITYELEGDEAVIIGSNVEYAPKNEFNETLKHKTGQAHFLRDGIYHTEEERNKLSVDILGK